MVPAIYVNTVGLRACYDEGKRCAETLFSDYARQHGLDIKMASEATFHGRVNLGNPHEATVLDIARHISDLLQTEAPFRFLPLPPDDPKRRCPDITLARHHLGWAPRMALEDGLRHTIAHFASRRRRQATREMTPHGLS